MGYPGHNLIWPSFLGFIFLKTTNQPDNFRGCSGMEGDEEEEGAVTGRLTLVPSIARSSSPSSSSVLSSSSSLSSSSPSRPSPPPPCLVWPGEGHRGECTGETLQWDHHHNNDYDDEHDDDCHHIIIGWSKQFWSEQMTGLALGRMLQWPLPPVAFQEHGKVFRTVSVRSFCG